jgi:hypothetical protein
MASWSASGDKSPGIRGCGTGRVTVARKQTSKLQNKGVDLANRAGMTTTSEKERCDEPELNAQY